MRYRILMLCFCCLGWPAWADTFDSSYSELRRPGQAIRNLGMGNTGVALSSDENALYYNPAGLAGVDSIMLNLTTMLEIPSISELQSSQDQLSEGASASIDLLHIRAMGSFSAILPFGNLLTVGGIYTVENAYEFAATVDTSGSSTAEKAANTILNSNIGIGVREDSITRFGAAMPVGSGMWVLGAQLNTVKRREQPFTTVYFSDVAGDLASDLTTLNTILAKAESNPASLSASEIEFLNNTTQDIQDLDPTELLEQAQSQITCYDTTKQANSYSLGFQRRLTSAPWLRMTFGAVAHNVGHVQFNGDDNCPRNEMVEYDLGFSAQPQWGPFRLLLAGDIRDISYANANDLHCQENKGDPGCLQKRMHFGAEFGFMPIDSGASFIAVRGGVSQNRPTWGLELNPFVFFRFFTIEYAHYTAVMGPEAGDGQNARDVLQLRFAF